MRDKFEIQVFCKWSAGRFLFWGIDEGQRPLDGMNLKLKLFAWHQDSYYGTFLEEDIINGINAVVLPADQALKFFVELPEGEYIRFLWSEEIKQLQKVALAIQWAIVQGQWQPDYGKWLKGQNGWKFNLPDNVKDMDLPYLDSWLDAIMDGYLENNPELQHSWQSLLTEYPLLKPRSLTQGGILNEDEWLTSIGWQRDETPFKICLQLAEPEDGVTWTLGIILQDKANTQLMKEYPLRRFRDRLGQEPNRHILPTSWMPFLDKVNTYITRWLQLLPWLMTAEGELKTYLSEEEAWDFLTSGSLTLVEAGYTVFLPSWWEQLRKNKPKLKVQTKSSVKTRGESMFGLQELVQFNWKLALGNLELSEEEFKGLVREKRRLIKFRGQWIQLDPKVLAEITNTIKQQRKGLTLGEVLQIHLLPDNDIQPNNFDPIEQQEIADFEQGITVEVELNASLAQMISQLTNTTSLKAFDPPQNFQGDLRNYQLLGFSWMLFLRKFGLGGCLADDMGLGKTIQFIAYLLAVKEDRGAANLRVKPSLLICPTSVIGNWQIELERFAPDLKVYVHYGNQRSKEENLIAEIENHDLVITSYNLALLDQESLQTQEWDCLCLDEAQNIKNAYTKQAKAIRTFKASQRLALTGTPMENRLTELWSIMDFVNPGYLGSFNSFSRKFVRAIEINRDPAMIELLQRLVLPFILRRLKTDPQIEMDLPDKQEYKEYLPLTAEQASLYENTLDEMSEKLEHATAMARRGVILGTLTKLKQVCDHPNLLLKESYPERNNSSLHTRSTKVERLLTMVEELRAEGDKCLIFTQFVGMGHLLQSVLQQRLEEPVFFLHGGVPKKQRDAMIKEFQSEYLIGKKESQTGKKQIQVPKKQVGIFILSLKAGGTGLNLTAANHVFHIDRWWNPAVENQATDRAHRIGQTRKVLVHKLITQGTLESRIDEMLTKKQNLNQLIMGKGESWITELSNSEIRELFALRRDWVVSD